MRKLVYGAGSQTEVLAHTSLFVAARSIIGVLLCCVHVLVCAESPAGFLWYNIPTESLPHHAVGVPFRQLSYTDKDAVLKFYTMEALHKVRFTHRLEDERVFLALQDYWLREATLHGQLNQQALRYYPQFDFSITHPTSSIGAQLHDTMKRDKQQKTIKNLAKHQGLLFFYRGNNAMDRQQITILKEFCESYHFSLISVSVDGTKAPDLPDTRLDHGQARYLGIRFFPAILLVNPGNQQMAPVAYGLTTQDVLITHLFAVAHEFGG